MSSFFQKLKQSYILGNTVQRLLYLTVGIGIISLIIQAFLPRWYNNLLPWVALSSNMEWALIRFWTFISYSFIHAGALHLLFNMLMLFFISQLFKTFFTEIQLLGVYVLGSIFAGLVYVATATLFQWNGLVVGASGAIMALLFTVTTYAPNMSVRLLLVGQVKMWHIAALVVVLDVIQLPVGNAGGHVAHLGGALFGFLYIKCLNKGVDLSGFIVRISALFSKKTANKTIFKNVYKNNNTPKGERKYNPIQTKVTKDATQQQIDAVLDKIKKSGYDSLSKEEKEFLFKQK